MPDGLVFRAATAADKVRTVALWWLCGLTTEHNPPELDFDRAIGSGSGAIFLCEDHDQLVGSVMVGDDGHRAAVYYMSVAPDVRMAGLGRQLMEKAEFWAKARGARKLNLMIREENTSVRAFYSSVGFEETPRLVMAKWLDR